MTVPNPAADPSRPQPQLQPHLQAPPQQAAYAPTAAPKPLRPPLTKEAAQRARLAGGVGGGIAWFGIGIAQLGAALLLLPVGIGALVFGLGFAANQDGTSATAGAWDRTLDWVSSPAGMLLAIGIPVGIAVALVGLWVSTRMLRHPGLRRPVGITWAGFGISLAGAALLSGVTSISLPFFPGVPFGGGDADFDMDRWGQGFGPDAMDQQQLQEWLSQGGGRMLEQLSDPGALLGVMAPWIVAGQMLALIVPIAISIFSWWWMAHAMRPGAAAVEQPAG